MPTTHSERSQALDTAGLIEFTRRLVRIPSVNRPGQGEAAAAAAVAELARSFGWHPVVEEAAPGRPNVIISLDGGLPGRTLLFEGHTDVVTEGAASEWDHDPFGGELVDGRIYGRGAADMKGGVSAMLHAARVIEEAGPFPGTIVLAILCDEEEMMIGVSDFIARGHAAGIDAAIVCEPEAGEICTVQKGAIRLRVDLTGEMAHGAMPHQGRNPIVAAAALVTAMETLESELQDLYGEHEHLGLPYITCTHLTAGSLPQLNVIPSQAVMTLDLRTVPGIEHGQLLRRIAEIAEGISAATGIGIRFEVLVDRPATETSRDEAIVRAVVTAHEKVTGAPAVFGGVPGTTDGTILWRDAGLPVVVYGPGGKWIAHQKDEYVEVDDLITHARVYIEAALEFLRS